MVRLQAAYHADAAAGELHSQQRDGVGPHRDDGVLANLLARHLAIASTSTLSGATSTSSARWNSSARMLAGHCS